MTKQSEQDFRGAIAILLIMFGGIAGFGALLMLFIQKNSYNNGEKPAQSLVVKNMAAVTIIIFIANIVVSDIGNRDSYSYLHLLSFPFGMLLAKTLLIDKNIHLMHKNFWKNLDLKATDLSTLITTSSSNSSSKKTSNSPQKYASQSTKNTLENQPITINNQGDSARVFMILLALLILIGFLGVYYLAGNSDVIEELLTNIMASIEYREK